MRHVARRNNKFQQYDFAIALALRNLRQSKLRTLLTVLGVSIGIASLAGMVSLGVGLQDQFVGRFMRSGMFDSISVLPGSTDPRGPLAGGRGRGRGNARRNGAPPSDVAPRTLDETALADLAKLEHVKDVYPILRVPLEVKFGEVTEFAGATGVAVPLNDAQNVQLNPVAVNCIRHSSVYGTVIWGARTTQGNDDLASLWKYVPVRRLALFLEESLYRGTEWAVFEPNGEPLWAQIRLNAGSFMQTLFKQGAFQGSSPQQAYFVKCDSETTTSEDQDNGIVNIQVGFAPLKPAEFIVIQIEQMAGQTGA